MFVLFPGPELAVSDRGNSILDPTFCVVTLAGNDAAGKVGVKEAVVGLDDFGGRGSFGLQEV